jgi:hypothetical protein
MDKLCSFGFTMKLIRVCNPNVIENRDFKSPDFEGSGLPARTERYVRVGKSQPA